MITRTIPSWHQSLINAFRQPDELAHYLQIDPAIFHSGQGLNTKFSMLAPRGFADRMEKGNHKDPLLLQVMPRTEELHTKHGYSCDPVGDADATVAPGVLHKYSSRALLITTGACAIHCRYCFRRNFPYSDSNACSDNLHQALEYLQANRDITEVILSGGDPLILSDAALKSLVLRLEKIGHIQRLRIHSRIPVILPERVTPEIINLLSTSRFQTILVIHSNHANELDESVSQTMRQLKQAGITLLNQSVLLRGINDNPATLYNLSNRLFSIGILPYYLHMLDHALGTTHFELSAKEATSIHLQLQAMLPGYLVPKLVYERAGAKSKLLLS
jgi:L-lysine 2,3-aminomutase